MSSHTNHKSKQANCWSLDKAREFYSIKQWGEGYFDINGVGNVVAKVGNECQIDIAQVAEEIKQQDFSLPVLVRFPQILQARTRELDSAFKDSAKKYHCDLRHIACYPIKVNQQRAVIENILASNCQKIGLEVGSKTELLVALGLLEGKQQLLICNGYKDRAYIRLALYAQIMGLEVFIVVESPSELSLIKQESDRLDLNPNIGLRLKLNSIAQGNWQNSGGRDAKFGLNASDILYCLDMLKQWDCQLWLNLIHFHMGSQIPKLNDFTLGLQEALHVYADICSLGFELNYIDVGGGLAIDYASQHDASYFSRAYSIKDYSDAIVKTVRQYCEDNELTLPTLLTENGRAISAHHAMLITNVVKVREHQEKDYKSSETQHTCYRLMDLGEQLLQKITDSEMDISHLKALFEGLLNEKIIAGEINLQQRAWAEGIIQKCEHFESLDNISISSKNTEKYYCNFSVFQSMPDVWGLQQIFPIMPLTRLRERPSVQAELHDLTCDSDGKIAQYAYDHSIYDYLTLHELCFEQEYLLGFFLLGAYQEVLGDIHNLFGDTHSVNVIKNDQDKLEFCEIEVGDCVNELLASIHLDGAKIVQRCKRRIDGAKTTKEVAGEMLEEINNALYGYTYLDSIDRPSYKIKG